MCVAYMQTFATPVHPGHRAARCRDLLSRGVFSAVARSGVLHLRAPPPTTAAAAELHAALATLRAAALRAVLAVAVQLTGNRGAMHELARLLAAPEDGCLGDRAADILKAAQPPSAPRPPSLRLRSARLLCRDALCACMLIYTCMRVCDL